MSPRQELAKLTVARSMGALAELLREGSEVTFGLLSRRSGVPERTLYRHYETKEGLFGAFWTWLNASIEMPPAPETPDEVTAHIPLLFAAFDRDEALVRAILHHPYGRSIRLAHAEQRREKFRSALSPIIEGLASDKALDLLASVSALCSATGWEMMRDTWRIDTAAAGTAAQWAVGALISAAARESQQLPDQGDDDTQLSRKQFG